jgi:beta-lactamase superfamily II metal-dependent hydrolase
MNTIQLLPVGCADAIVLSFSGNDTFMHHIVLDSGDKMDNRGFKNALKHLPNIDLLILTHIDNDHIGGLGELINDVEIIREGFIKNCWFNALSKVKNQQNTEGAIGIKEGKLVRDFLTEKLGIKLDFITTATPPLDLFGAKLTVVSPDAMALDKMLNTWRKKELVGNKPFDYNKTIEELAAKPYPNFDTSLANRSSIAFLFEYRNFKMLFLADSHPSVVTAALRNLGYSEVQKLRLDYLKVAHHGSRKNTSEELLGLIDCRNFVFTAVPLR